MSVYVHESLEFHQRYDMTVINEYLECLFIELRGKELGVNGNIIVGVVYRPPNSDIGSFNEPFSAILEKLKHMNNICYCMGDYNINILKNEIHRETGEFLDMMYSNSFMPLINRPTRITDSCCSVIDNIFCNNLDTYVEQIPGVLCTDLSDHFPVFVLNWHCGDSPIAETLSKRVINESNVNRLKETLRNYDWCDVLASSDCQEAFTVFNEIIISKFNDACPVKEYVLRNRKDKPWITKGLRISIKHKNKLFRLFKNNKSNFTERQYKLYKGRL